MEAPRKIELAAAFARFAEHWSPKVVGDVNDCQIKLAKLEGEFVWHRHEHEDELFLVVKGRLKMQLRTGDLELGPGELVIVPRNVEHCPAAAEECWVLLVEPRTTLNTGDAVDPRMVLEPERLV